MPHPCPRHARTSDACGRWNDQQPFCAGHARAQVKHKLDLFLTRMLKENQRERLLRVDNWYVLTMALARLPGVNSHSHRLV